MIFLLLDEHSKQKKIGHIVQNTIFAVQYDIYRKPHSYASFHGLSLLDGPCRIQFQRVEQSTALSWPFLYHAVYYSNNSAADKYNVLNVIYSWATLTTYPLYYLYIKAITDNHKPGKGLIALLFSPGIIAAAASVSVLIFGIRQDIPDLFISIIRPIQAILVSVMSLIKLKAFDRSVYDSYSEVEGKTAKPVMILVGVQFTAAICTVVLSFLGQRYFTGKTVLAVPSVLFAGTIYAIAYVGFRYRFGAFQMENELKEDNGKRDGVPAAGLIGCGPGQINRQQPHLCIHQHQHPQR